MAAAAADTELPNSRIATDLSMGTLNHALQKNVKHTFRSPNYALDMTYAQRFSDRLKKPGKSVQGVADAMKVSRQAVYSITRGDSKSASAANNAAAAAYFECNPNWLATGEGSEDLSDSTKPDLQDAITIKLAQYGLLLRQIKEPARSKFIEVHTDELVRFLVTNNHRAEHHFPEGDKQ